MSDVVQQFEAACRNFEQTHSKESEALISQFKKQPLAQCRHLFTHSTASYARFSALSGMQDALLREWNQTPRESSHEIRSELLSFVLAHPTEVPYVRTKAFSLVAVITKRGWMQGSADENQHFFGSLVGLLTHQDSKMHVIALSALHAILTEFGSFAPSIAAPGGAAGLSWDASERCRISFQGTNLLPIFQACTQFVQQCAGQIQPSQTEALQALHLALELLIYITTWDFSAQPRRRPRSLPGESSPYDHGGSGRKRTTAAASQVLPPASQWRGVINAPGLLQIAFGLHQHFRNVSQIANNARQLLLSLASLSNAHATKHPLFTEDELVHYMSYFTSHIFDAFLSAQPSPTSPPTPTHTHPHTSPSHTPTPTPNYARNATASELVDLCRILHRLVVSHGWAVLVRVTNAQNFFERLTELTCAVLQPEMAFDETFDFEAFDYLLEAWVSLALVDPTASNALKGYAVRIFAAFLEWRVRRAVAELGTMDDSDDYEDFEDQSVVLEQLDNVACLARLDLQASLPMLQNKLNELLALWKRAVQFPADYRTQITKINEALSWLLRFVGHVIADSDHGEDAVIPDSILSQLCLPAHTQGTQAEVSVQDPLYGNGGLVVTVLDYLGQCVQVLQSTHQGTEQQAPVLSPYVVETLLSVVFRWAAVYFLPNLDNYSPQQGRKYHPYIERYSFLHNPQNVLGVLDFFLQSFASLFQAWSFEDEVCKGCCRLLLAWAKHSTCSKLLYQYCTGWWQLVGNGIQTPALSSTPAHTQHPVSLLSGASPLPTHTALLHALSGISLEVQGDLVEAFARVSTGCAPVLVVPNRTPAQIPSTLQEATALLVTPLRTHLQALMIHIHTVCAQSHMDADQIFMQHPEYALCLRSCLARWRGLLRAGNHPLLQPVLLPLCGEVIQPLLQLVSGPPPTQPQPQQHSGSPIAHPQSPGAGSPQGQQGQGQRGLRDAALLHDVLQLFADIVGSQIHYLGADHCRTLLQLFLTAASHYAITIQHPGAGTYAASPAVAQDDQTKADGISVVLKTLDEICSKEFMDWSTDGQATSLIPDAVIAVLEMFVPLMTANMFQDRDFAFLYIHILNYLAWSHAARYSTMPPQLFHAVKEFLFSALSHHDKSVASAGLEILRGIGTTYAQPNMRGSQDQVGIMLGSFLETVLQHMLLDEFDLDLLEAGSDVVFVLSAASAPERFGLLFQQFLAGHQSQPALHTRLSESLQAFGQAMGTRFPQGFQLPLDRAHLGAFRDLFVPFLVSLRGHLLFAS
eukprot:gnl/Trimastix_PCT/3619.p1 GENE.gnl/Trimastix_PCT/3619~~gnl/Trimastix_PCT/3619.p1  ORF type:complete len:1262 (-),score=225.33 gnl/Trimastix_PCT/3619:86-3871(-)